MKKFKGTIQFRFTYQSTNANTAMNALRVYAERVGSLLQFLASGAGIEDLESTLSVDAVDAEKGGK